MYDLFVLSTSKMQWLQLNFLTKKLVYDLNLLLKFFLTLRKKLIKLFQNKIE
jgi:hypothetical protein